jgi:AraC-like DNA-binding protein
MAFAQPATALRGFVDTYVGYDEYGTSFTRRHELPSAHAVLIVNLGAAITVVDTAGFDRRVAVGTGFGAGLSEAYAITESGGSQRGFQVMFTPQGAGRFFRLPMHLLGNRVFGLDELLGAAEARQLIERLQAARNWAEGFRRLDAMVATRIMSAQDVDLAGAREAAWALRQLAASHGQIAIGTLADEIGCSRKHVAMLFREHLGLTPKSVARILRFRHVLQLIDVSPLRWSEIAQAAGYADQAHFANDFRQITGRSPGAYLALRLPDQAGLPVG